MVPVDVGEHLTRKSVDDDAGSCLARLVTALEKAKEEAAKTEAAKAEAAKVEAVKAYETFDKKEEDCRNVLTP